jgi:DNA-binding LacI/PurR family transcriptional regulator
VSATDGAGMATLHQVAAAAGVSTATAARALGNYGAVKPATRERVQAAALRLGYRANTLARSLITGSTRTVGVVLSDIENPFFSRALRGISDVAHRDGYEAVVVNTDEKLEIERDAVRVLLEKRVDGLLVAPSDGADVRHLTRALESRTPVVLLDRRVRGLLADTVGIDNRATARDATRRLIELGHRRIALVTGAPPSLAALLQQPDLRGVAKAAGGTTGLRAAGFRDALLAADIPLDPRYISADGLRRDDAARATERLLAMDEPPTAIIALDSLLSLGVLQAFGHLGTACPTEVSLVGFDDADWAEAVSPPLSVVSQPVYRIGETAAELLLSRIRGAQGRPVHRKLPTTYVERGSTGPAPGQSRARS